MIDIHSHILFGVDDGSNTVSESVALVNAAADAGIEKIICTPHYTGNSKEDYNNEHVDINFERLKKEVAKLKLDVQIYLGNEVAVYGNVTKLLEEGQAKHLASSRYMLIEFPMQVDVDYCVETVYEMRIRGIIPIIAHPERCACFQHDYHLVKKLIEEGAYIQINIGSVFGSYGKKEQKMARKLLKDNLVHFIATDTHRISNNKYEKLKDQLNKLEKKIGKEKLVELTCENQKKIIVNEEI